MTDSRKQILLNYFADGFDTYLADGRMPAGVEGDDVLAQYVRGVVDRNPNLGGADPDYREAFKDNMQAFLGEMIDGFEKIDRDGEPEQLLHNRFVNGSPGERRAMWRQVSQLTGMKYTQADLDTAGYDSQLTAANEQVIFDMFAREWGDALARRTSRTKHNLLSSASAEWEKSCERRCRQDYRVRKQLRKSMNRYPQLAAIAGIIGRRENTVSRDHTSLARRYSPTSISTAVTSLEIDRITTGNDLECTIPTEFSYLAHPETELIFMMRYSLRQLQQFSSPGRDSSVKAPRAEVNPRPAQGPIIVSVDTSSSMDGRASELALAMLYQLLEIARSEKRQCYLITFSVRSQAIDLSQPGEWRRLESFLSNSYTGGTNGEQMLRDAIRQLHTENYSMADVLIISDFAFATPLPATLSAMRAEQHLGTRFYGLKIGRLITPYASVLDKIWTVE